LAAIAAAFLLAALLSRAAARPFNASALNGGASGSALVAIAQACGDAGGDATACGGDFAAAWSVAIQLDLKPGTAITGARCGTGPGDASQSCVLSAGDFRITGPASAADIAHGIADFGAGDSIGGGHGILARTAAGDWQPWLAGNGTIHEPLRLPGDALVCAGGDGLTLRAGPGIDAAALDVLADRTRVRAEQFVLSDPSSAGTSGFGWYRVSSPETGWVSSKYLENAGWSDGGLPACSSMGSQ